jgi:hypothetical protein
MEKIIFFYFPIKKPDCRNNRIFPELQTLLILPSQDQSDVFYGKTVRKLKKYTIKSGLNFVVNRGMRENIAHGGKNTSLQ